MATMSAKSPFYALVDNERSHERSQTDISSIAHQHLDAVRIAALGCPVKDREPVHVKGVEIYFLGLQQVLQATRITV